MDEQLGWQNRSKNENIRCELKNFQPFLNIFKIIEMLRGGLVSVFHSFNKHVYVFCPLSGHIVNDVGKKKKKKCTRQTASALMKPTFLWEAVGANGLK